LFAYARDRRRFLVIGGSRSVDEATQIDRAERLLDSLLKLGPTFIKLGQLLSTRPDVLPAAYIDVLSSLQDDVPAAEWAEAEQVLEAEVGPVDEVFGDFETEPISGASLGQVYRATANGDDVAVKVRRPGVEGLVEADLRVIRWSLPILLYFVSQAQAFSLENLADEFAETIREEMDYQREARMLEEIKANFSDSDEIRIPAVFDDYSGPRVLTMEYLPGTKINDVDELDARDIDRQRVAESLERAYLQMIIEDGVFHADPHPGNLAVLDDGSIVFYDFGMSGRVDEFVQDRIVEFYVAIANQDIDAILDALVEMGTLSPEANREVMGNVMELAIADARGEDVEQYRVQQIIGQIEDSIYEFPFRLPPNLALVLRVATVVEGVCVTLDPKFDFIDTATTYLTKQGYREETARQFVSDAGEQVQDAAQSLVRVPPKLEETLDTAQRGNLTVQVELGDDEGVIDQLARRIVSGLVFGFSLLSTAYLYQGGAFYATAVSGVIGLGGLILLWRSFRSKSGIRASPQFTRREMTKRREND
jgi:predicted unusual protein kinase regulating ubiquinone biosynthesis (AarF/ABC1/UbiB family)